MGITQHRMPVESFRAVARGGGGPVGVDRLFAARYSRNLLSLRAMVDLTAERAHPDAEPVARAWRQLVRLRTAHPEATRRILLYPTVGVWIADTLATLRSADPASARPAALAQVAAAVALAARSRARVDFPTPTDVRGVFALPGLGHLRVPGRAGTVVLEVNPGAMSVDGVPVSRPALPDGPVWSPLPRLRSRSGVDISLDRLWTLADPATARPVSRAEADLLHASLADAWWLLAVHHRHSAREVAAAISMVMPVSRRPVAAGDPPARAPAGAPAAGDPSPGPDPGRADSGHGLVSGTHPAGAGCVALSAGGDPPALAAALVHELQHSKLAALADLFPLVEPHHDLRLPAPWRPDPRPLPALVQGVYAHASVLGFWHRQWHREAQPRGRLVAQVEFSRLRAACREMAEALLATDGLTSYGRLLVGEIRRAVAGWQRVAVPRTALAIAGRAAAGQPSRRPPGDPIISP
ncbi:HEXXH motif-containing putative peptide modification protein [Micromonospora sp. NPDC126480]|uniref:aKG-HExxH-type peptide beta-hydroxylase n=1 Tax=Micromonospora sp. NPDC126480 TaxID=3155312 RepID=UPI00331947E2